MTLRPIAGALIAALAALAPPVRAASLGEARALSALGSPLRAEIPLAAARPGDVDLDCFRLRAPQAGDTLPALVGSRMTLRQGAAGPVLVITTERAVGEPILSFVVENVCGQVAAREYALFLDPPAAQGAVAAAADAARLPAPAARREAVAPAEWEMVAGESLASLAEALYPDSRGMQRRFVAAVRRANPQLASADATAPLAAGTRLTVPRLRPAAAAATSTAAGAPERQAARPQAAEATPREPPRERRSKAAGATAERLRIESAPQEVIRELVARERAAGVNVVDTAPGQPGSPLDLMNRKIGELELIEAQLRAQIAEIDARIEATRAQLAAQAAPAPAAAAVIAAAPPPAPAALAGPPMWATLLLGGLIAIAGVGTGVGAAMLLRRRGEAPARRAAASAAARMPAAASDRGPPAEAGLARGHGEQDRSGGTDDDAGGIEVSDLNFLLGLQDGHDAAHPEAAATKVLARYLEAKGLRNSVPWLALLDGFRAANLREEYDSLAKRVRVNYNVQVPPWDEPSEEPAALALNHAPLEEYPHLVRRIVAAWGTDACLEYLDSLLQDNRNGTRSGFPMAVLGDILTLISLIEARRETDSGEARRPVVTPLRRAGQK